MNARPSVLSRSAPPRSSAVCYLYGIMLPEPGGLDALPERGIGNREVRFMPHHDLAAVVSPVETSRFTKKRGAELVRNLRAHTAVLSRIAEKHTILPAGFGIELETDELEEWLSRDYDKLRKELDRVEGRVELKVQVSYTEEGAVRRVFRENPALLKRLRAARRTHTEVAFGKEFANAVQTSASRDARKFLSRLRQVAEKAAEHPSGDRDVISVSLLVQRKAVPDVDEILREIDAEEEAGIDIACIGPLPPYSFITPLLERRGGYCGLV